MDNGSKVMPGDPAVPFSREERGSQDQETVFTIVLGTDIVFI